MFTGIVQARGEVASTADHLGVRHLRLTTPRGFTQNLSRGDSLAVNGCCLTATATTGNSVDFDVIAQTLQITNLGSLAEGDAVNLERAARLGDEIGGHLLSGHIACTTALRHRQVQGDNLVLWFDLASPWQRFVLTRGYVALDGASLTVADLDADGFAVALIPETRRATHLGDLAPGDAVNLEVDAQTQTTVETLERVLAQRT